jgi:hypothetical protein
MPTFSESSVRLIFRLAIMTSKFTMIAIVYFLDHAVSGGATQLDQYPSAICIRLKKHEKAPRGTMRTELAQN